MAIANAYEIVKSLGVKMAQIVRDKTITAYYK